MWIFTHIQLAKACMNQVQHTTTTLSSKWAFLYGNIQPDITKQAQVKHHVDLTYERMYDALNQSMDRGQTMKARWRALGVVCHYLADYSCRFHIDASDKQKPLLKHLHYEWCLHRYIKMQLTRKEKGPLTLSISTINEIHQSMEKLMYVRQMDKVNKKRAIETFVRLYERHMPSYHTDYIFGITGMQMMAQIVVALWQETPQVVVPSVGIKSDMVI